MQRSAHVQQVRASVTIRWLMRRHGTWCFQVKTSMARSDADGVLPWPTAWAAKSRILSRNSIPWPRHEIGTFKSRRELRHEDIVPARAHQRPVAKVDRAIKIASQQRVAELVEGDALSSLVGGSITKTLAP